MRITDTSARPSLLILGLLLALSSCRSTQTHSYEVKSNTAAIPKKGLGLGLNDLSILMPRFIRPDVESKLPFFKDEAGDNSFGTDFIKSDDINKGVFNDFLKVTPEILESFKLTAVRFVPCANELTAGTDLKACVSTMQIIWQPTAGQFLDRGLHTIYILTRDEFQATILSLKKLNEETGLETENLPLSVHPIISREGDGPYFKGLMKIVKERAQGSRLFGFASMQSATSEIWSMKQFAMKSGVAIGLPVATIPVSPNGDLSQGFFDTGAMRGDFAGSPESLGDVKIPFIERRGGRGVRPLPAEEIARLTEIRIKSAILIDNPLLHDIKNMDCAGCHLSYNTIKERPEGFQLPETAYRSKRWDLSVTTDLDITNTSLQMFSYVGGKGKPKITQRVINETASALDTLVTMGFLPAPESWLKGE